MRAGVRGFVALAGAAFLVGPYLVVPMTANAATSTPAVTFANAKFHGYGTGTEVGLTAATIGGTSLAAVGQGLSSASTNSAGLTSPITSVPGNVVNPIEPGSVKAYGSGSGLDLGVGATPAEETPLLGGMAHAIAPPISPESTSHLTNLALGPIGNVGTLDNAATAFYPAAGQACPLGQPISFGEGDAANANLVDLSAIPSIGGTGGSGNAPLLNTAGSSTAAASSSSTTSLTPNGDGTFGLTSHVQETITPITVNVLGLLQLQLTVAGATPNSPVTLDATTSGEASKPATLKLANDDVINLEVAVAGGAYMEVPGFPVTVSSLGPNGEQVPLSTTSLGSNVQSLLDALTGPQLTSILGPIIGGARLWAWHSATSSTREARHWPHPHGKPWHPEHRRRPLRHRRSARLGTDPVR